MLVIAPPHHLNGRPPQRVLLALVGAALLLHAALLMGVRLGLPQAERSASATPVQVRMLQAPRPVSVPVPVPQAEPAAAAPSPAPPPRPAATPAVPAAQAEAALPPAEAPRFEAAASQAARELPATADVAAESAVAAVVPAVPAAPETPEAAAVAAAPASSEGEIPLYRTLFPPPLTLRYELRRGALSGTGELQWRPAGGRYELRLEGRLAGFSVLVQTSQGGFDDAGIAPLRFTDQRMRRDVRAANFQRDVGKITFSGPATEYPLLIGTQDRLSWMIQLAAVAAAEPQRMAPGGKVALYVVGARGDADIWVFRYAAHETVQTETGPVRAVKFAREPRTLYDTTVEAWLDPARHHLPVRARLSTSPDGEALELLLREMNAPP